MDVTRACRWILVIPGALVAQVAVGFAGCLLFGFNQWLTPSGQEASDGHHAVLWAFQAAALVSAGAAVAPTRKAAVARALALLAMLAAAVMAIESFRISDWTLGTAVWHLVGAVVGSESAARAAQRRAELGAEVPCDDHG